MAKDRARDSRRQFKDVGSLQRMGEALGWSRQPNKYLERETQIKKAGTPNWKGSERISQPHVYDVYDTENRNEDYDPTPQEQGEVTRGRGGREGWAGI